VSTREIREDKVKHPVENHSILSITYC